MFLIDNYILLELILKTNILFLFGVDKQLIVHK